MKPIYLLILAICFSSCKDDISNKRYRNENYVFYKEDGKQGEWRKINPNLKLVLPKSHSTYFFPNGSRHSELEVLDTFPNRIIKYFDKTGRLTYITRYKNDTIFKETFENGYHKEYHSNYGNLSCEGLIENGMQQGIWKYYRENGKTLENIIEFKNDTINGIQEDYWENGNLKVAMQITMGNFNGKNTHYYKSGQIKEIDFMKNDMFNGKTTTYHLNGRLRSELYYWNDKPIDTAKFYYESGKLKDIRISNLDTTTLKSSGNIISFYESGALKETFDTKNEIADGEVKIYYENGNLSQHYFVKQASKEGNGKTYFENGQLQYAMTFKDDLIQGTMKQFDESGKLIKTYSVKNGKATDSIIH
ncbi:toxin-antitoxin system YwqK family antitoxin [Mangrovimonas aestuarii]|uniref:toxin-antitoxin system YwqK family antitoxin n=1 Tax=Mangrovimonas aestuarii TaxID=3018443 RepID=UPI002378AAF9|nr:toxin-antitoxin system YwqK family antitoxin [Mangrovimonas aestuarii]